jgi:hypothetical protein
MKALPDKAARTMSTAGKRKQARVGVLTVGHEPY